MNEILKKLGYKGQNPVLVLNLPVEYGDILKDFDSEVQTDIKGKYKFIQVFAKSMDEVAGLFNKSADTTEGDAVFWICYPKGTSKKYKSDCKRDTINDFVKQHGFTAVAMISIDDDWSGLRIRRPEYVKQK